MTLQPLTVALADRAYPIYFTNSLDALQRDLAVLRAAKRAVRVLSDATVLAAQPDYLRRAGFADHEILALPAGEPTKSVDAFSQALSFLAKDAMGRDCALFAFGGGVIGDLAGFVAASYLRGIDFYQIPTTLLSMVDSSVGGKTGINLPEGKNLVGAFWQPKAVYIDAPLLRTLAPREFSAGMAEVIKYGLLADAALFEQLERDAPALTAEAPGLTAVIRRCCEIKAEIVADDERETAGSGGRALLNLGHTFGHAVENAAGYGSYLHGEAVAIGLYLATRLSVELGQLEAGETSRVRTVLEKYNLPTRLRETQRIELLMQAMQRDKKNRAGRLRFVTLASVGRALTSEGVPVEQVRQLWQEIGATDD